MSIHPQAQGYEQVADSYSRGRPDYPGPLINWICALTGIVAGDHVVELGAGTGKFTRSLVDIGATVTAVEPVDAMREQLHSQLPEVTALGGVAEDLPVESASAELVICAQSFHWFANDRSVAEIARILRPGRSLILVWNQRDFSDPIQAKLEAILVRHQDPTIPHSPDRQWKPVIDGASSFKFLEESRFDNSHELPRSGVFDRFRSMSLFGQLTLDQQEATLAELDALVPRLESVTLPYYTEAFAYQLVGPPTGDSP